jgi:DNA-binding transcriptional MerR regulator
VDNTNRQNEKDSALSDALAPGNIPDKLYFKIGEVKKITGIEPHVLRYWESEFKIIRPQRASSKQRLYRRVDVENILTIKKLLYEDGYTVPGARKLLTEKKAETGTENGTTGSISHGKEKKILAEIKRDLLQLKEMLENK